MGSDQHVFLDDPPGDRRVDGAWPDSGGVLPDLYRDDPDDIFVAEVPVDRRRLGLDEKIEGSLTARHFLEGFDPVRVNRSDGDGRGTPEASETPETPDAPETPERIRELIAAQVAGRPRLASLESQEPCVQRVYAAFGGSGFHGAERHEGSLDDQDHLLRLVERQDPAQSDESRRVRGIDAFKRGNGKHVCAESSTSICDPVAYAVALARGIDHPAVRAALDARHDPPRRPHYVHVPIVELLGESGDQFCHGHQLVGEDPREAVKERDVWAKSGWKGKPRDDLCPPQTERITTFRGGVIEFRIGHNAARDSYELISMFPRPRRDRIEGSDGD